MTVGDVFTAAVELVTVPAVFLGNAAFGVGEEVGSDAYDAADAVVSAQSDLKFFGALAVMVGVGALAFSE